MEESNQDEIIGGSPNDRIEEEDIKENESNEVTNGEAETEQAERAPIELRRVELLDCNAMNALMYHYYSQEEYVECKSLIGEILSKYNGRNEFALHTRGCIARIEGELDEALDWFTQAFEQSGKNHKYFYDIGRVNFLLGRHSIAVEQLEKAAKAITHNPKVVYWLARAIYHLPARKVEGKTINPVSMAAELLKSSSAIATDVQLVSFLGKLLEELDDVEGAIAAYRKGIEIQPDNTDTMCRLGLLYLRNNRVDDGFTILGQCLAYDPANSDAILAIGSIMQKYGDHDVALNKYRVASEVCDYNGCLWNNIGVGLMARDKMAAAHSALKKASFINPLNYKISYNLAVLHDKMQLYASALHYMKQTVDLAPKNAKAIGALATILSKLKDPKNARRSYIKSLEMKKSRDVLLNFAIFEYHQKNPQEAWAYLQEFKKMNDDGKQTNMTSTAEILEKVLASSQETT